MLHVGGYYDQEDINGPQLMYTHMEIADILNMNYLVLGPWNHGQWSDSTDHLGEINFKSFTTEWFKDEQKKWFDYWLKGKISEESGNRKENQPFKEAWCFQTGSNEWKSYDQWPPKETRTRHLYVQAGNKCSFDKPSSGEGYASYISDPSKPVPYRTLPIAQPSTSIPA